MGTTIAGNQHIGSNYKKAQYLWAPGLGSEYAEVELYEEDRIFLYQFNPLYDQRDDGVYAVEFYYYYRKPTSQEFWDYCYNPDNFYFFPFIAWYDEDSGDGGQFGSISTSDSKKISLVGRESGWIHVTLHMEEAIWGRYMYNGQPADNPLYIGFYSPLPVFCWDNSISGENPVIPYEVLWDFSEYEEEENYVYETLIGGYLEDCYVNRDLINDYPSFYITYRDVRPESFAYSVNEAAVMNVTSGVIRKSVYKKLLKEIKEACGTTNRKLIIKRNSGRESVSLSDSFSRKQIFKRLFQERKNPASFLKRNNSMSLNMASELSPSDEKINRIFFSRKLDSVNDLVDDTEKKLDYKRLLEPDPNIKSELSRKQELYREAESSSHFYALPFASRFFFRAVETVMGFWDWLRGKIREANNVASFYCPIWTEIELECRI